jgi:hypothetical protein
MDYHLEITKRSNCVGFFIFFRDRGNNILTFFFFYVLNFLKKYMLDLI